MAEKLERTGDQETDEILGEIEREGGIVGPEEEQEEDSLESAEEAEQADDEEEPVSEDESEEDESGDESDDEEGDEELESSAPARATSESTSQYERRREAYWKDKAGKLQEKLDQIGQETSQAKMRDSLKDLAESEKIPLDRLMKIVDAVSESVKGSILTPEERENLNRASQFAAREQESVRQDTLFNQEFRESVLPLLTDDDDKQAVYDKLYADAFAPKPENQYDPRTGRPAKSLVQIFVANSTRPIRRSGESTRIRSISGGGRKPITEMSAEEIDNMSDDQFDKLSDEAAMNAPRLSRPNRNSV